MPDLEGVEGPRKVLLKLRSTVDRTTRTSEAASSGTQPSMLPRTPTPRPSSSSWRRKATSVTLLQLLKEVGSAAKCIASSLIASTLRWRRVRRRKRPLIIGSRRRRRTRTRTRQQLWLLQQHGGNGVLLQTKSPLAKKAVHPIAVRKKLAGRAASPPCQTWAPPSSRPSLKVRTLEWRNEHPTLASLEPSATHQGFGVTWLRRSVPPPQLAQAALPGASPSSPPCRLPHRLCRGLPVLQEQLAHAQVGGQLVRRQH
mmetsp:Transcript_79821/g.165920  ORF Transcript_79821/g.165920 Transcript_79821/m.165920 type:complete len:256 (-) Transcript_79821:556-1323(-)